MFEAIKIHTSYQRYLPSALTCFHTSDKGSCDDLMPRVDLILTGHFEIKRNKSTAKRGETNVKVYSARGTLVHPNVSEFGCKNKHFN